jgi:hypothetical protein
MNALLRSVGVLAAFLLVACAPDRSSGPDAERHTATYLETGKWVADSLDAGGGDATDWKVLVLEDTGFLTLEAVLDDPRANVTIEAFDRFGKPMARATHRDGDGPQVKLTTDVGIGKVFARISAGKGTKTGYTIKASVR